MSGTRTGLGALIVTALSLGATAIDSSSAYAKGHRFRSFLPRDAQARGLDAIQATRQRAESWEAYGLPTNPRGQVVNYADYQRGGTN
jgi:hypothetical protein